MENVEFYLNHVPKEERVKETQPNFKVSKPVVIDEKKYWVNAWSGKNNIGPYVKVSLNPVIDDEKYQAKKAQEVPEVPETDEFDDDIPF